MATAETNSIIGNDFPLHLFLSVSIRERSNFSAVMYILFQCLNTDVYTHSWVLEQLLSELKKN